MWKKCNITTDKTTSETSYNVGDIVTYTATVNIPSDTALTQETAGNYTAGHGPIILHDKMDSALTFSGTSSITAKVGTDVFNGFTAVASTPSSSLSDGCTFEITIPVTSALLGKSITFTYTAEVNSTAAADTGFVNDLFGEINGYKTNPDDVKVYTFDFDLDKNFQDVTGDSAASYSATFELTDSAGNTIYFTNTGNNYVKVDSYDGAGSATLTVNGKDNINVRGLKAGTYTLTEKTTANGYNPMQETVSITITEAADSTPDAPKHTVTYQIGSGSSVTNKTVTIENNKGSVLPSTGGSGTTMIYIIGVILLAGAGILLVTRRRMKAE